MEMFSGLLNGGINAISSWMNTTANNQNSQEMQRQAEQFNQSQTLQQEQFQKDMSNTAYQRASADMKAAGLNPMMMFGSGSAASSPSGGSSTIQPAQKTSAASGVGQALSSIIPSAVAMKTAQATIDNLVAQNAKIKAETLTESQRPAEVVARTSEADSGAFAKSAHGQLSNAERDKVVAELPTVVDTSLSAKNRSEMNPTVRKVLDVGAFSGNQVNHTIAPIANLLSSAKGVRSLFNDRYYY